MAEAKIEIVAKPIKGFEGAKDFASHHLYILITMSTGTFGEGKREIR